VNEFGATGEEEVVEENNYTTAYAAPTYTPKFQSIKICTEQHLSCTGRFVY
jgi:hypothetical protein